MTVAVVALFEVAEDSFFRRAPLFGSFKNRPLAARVLRVGRRRDRRSLAIASVTADLGCGVKKDLHLGIGEDGGTDVAAFHDHTAGNTKGTLLADHPGAEVVVDGDLRGGGGNVLFANAMGNVNSVEQNTVAFELRLEGNRGVGSQIEQGRLLVEGMYASRHRCPYYGYSVEFESYTDVPEDTEYTDRV